MDYLTIEQAKQESGLRLVLTRDVPGPWSEAAKAVLRWHGLDYQAAEQIGGRDNKELVEWTGHRNAPIALYNDEPPRVRWQEILDLAERLGNGTSLYPQDVDQRIQMVGIASEICNEGGMAWHARMLMLNVTYQVHGDAVFEKNPMFREYGFSEAAVMAAIERIEQILEYLAETIKSQKAAGYVYLVGDSMTAADIYWACFSNMLEALPHELNPMPDSLRQGWGALAKGISGYDPLLIEQRDAIFEKHLWLPLEF
ncbi:glutathione binding-like protein [Gammaproteobacteria bacterium]|nr:glutathione binding-like protein [Gammaproteobacteria bacterium]